MAYAYYYLGKLDKALNYFHKALEIDEKNGEALGGKASVLQDIHKREEALSFYN